MYPLLRIGPLNLSSGGLLLLLGIYVGSTLAERAARRRGGAALADQLAWLTLPALAGAAVGGRLWYGLLSWELYGASPQLFIAPRIADLAWPGALLGGLLAGWLCCRWRGFAVLAVNAREERQRVAAYMAEARLSFPALLDQDGAVGAAYQARVLPSSFFIDKAGVVRAVYRGPLSRGVVAGTVEQLLAEEP